jgi:hypothetical protein
VTGNVWRWATRSKLQWKGTNLARRRCLADGAITGDRSAKTPEYPVGNNKDPNQKQPGEKQPGEFHYNPGNMSGKTAGTQKKDESESQSTADNGRRRPNPHPQGK